MSTETALKFDPKQHDFGFSMMDEDELRVAEQEALQHLEIQSTEVERLKSKLTGLHSMILPLLNNLMKDPSKSYLYWPNRVEKIESFKKRLDEFLTED